MGVKATVLAISSDRTLSLQAGIMKVTAREDEVLLLEHAKVEVKTVSEKSAAKLRSISVPSEVDLRGMMTDEAEGVVDLFLDNACMSHLTMVTIIHGKGTGALRKAVHQQLKRHHGVKSFRLGRYGEGEDGVTVVEMKS